jgi:hypothetical protein
MLYLSINAAYASSEYKDVKREGVYPGCAQGILAPGQRTGTGKAMP